MPLRVRLQLSSAGSLARPSPEQLHAVACTLLDGDADHRAPLKAFSVANSHRTRGGWCLELGLVDDALGVRLDRSLTESGGVIRFGSDVLQVARVTVVSHATWGQLADQADDRRLLGVRFRTPLHFRRSRSINLLPVPSAVFGHWRQRWEVIAGRAPECPFDDRAVHVRHLNVRTRTFTYREQTLHGIVGDVVYDLGDLDSEHRAAIDALARLAPYAGCGSRTTAGFGATDIFQPER